jgi:hypothetical protein
MTRTPTLSRGPFVLAVLPLLFASAAAAYPAAKAPTCTPENTITAYVVALDRVLYMNRFGSSMPGGMIYALARDVFPKTTATNTATNSAPGYYSEKNSCRFAQPSDPNGKTTCAPGSVQLRPDKRPRPLVLRVHEGDCLEIHFTNLLSSPALAGQSPLTWQQPTTPEAGVHVQGLNWVYGPKDDGSNVGRNVSSLVAPGESKAYKLYAEHEGSYLLYSTADDWSSFTPVSTGAVSGGDGGTLAEGLFGAVNVQPSGRRFHQDWQSEFYRSQVTEQDLCLASADAVLADPLHCARRAPHALPVLNYQALYPAGHPRAYLPILNMVCSAALTQQAIDKGVCVEGELVHGDLTATITGPSAPDPRLRDLPPQPQAFPNQSVDDLPPSLRPIYAYPDRLQPFREFTVIYHESFQVTQAFANEINNSLTSLQAAEDNFGINYGMAGLANEVLANRLGGGPLKRCVDCKYEEFFLSSWAMGDPAMNVDHPANGCGQHLPGCKHATRAFYPDDPSNVYHAYMSDHVRFRVLHAGPDLHHLHHQHAQQWLGTPNSPDGDYLDSQSIGPGSAFTLEMVYNGSGNVNQTVGDSIFHCHFYPHFASGMWSLWRVHDVFEGGTILGDDGRPCDRPCKRDKLLKAVIAVKSVKVVEHTRALPDGEIPMGTPTVALVPMPTLPMAPMPAAVRLQGVCQDNPATNCLGDRDCGGAKGSCTEMGSRYCVVQGGLGKSPEACLSEFQSIKKSWDEVEKSAYPGYPFFIPGIGGSRPPHPPLDFAYACAKSGRICDPTIAKDAQNPKVEGLQPAAKRAVRLHLLSEAPRPDYQAPIFRDQVCLPDEGECEPMDGGLPRAVTAQGPASHWRSLQTTSPAPGPQYQNLDFSKEIDRAQAIELPEVGTQIEKVAMKVHAQRFHDTQLPDGRKTGICSDNRAPCSSTDLAQCGNPAKATCTPGRINFILNGLGPKPGAPYADPCIRFDRNGGQPANMLTRSYLAADLQLDAIFNREGWHFPQQRILSLWGDVKDFLDRKKPPEPLFMRVNSYDCMTYVLANLVPNVYEQDEFQVRTPTDIIGQHIHLVKFDVTSSDGAENGWNYEDGTYAPNEVTERIRAIDRVGGIYLAPGESEDGGPCKHGTSGQRCLKAKYIKFFGPGPGAEPAPAGGSETTGAWLGSQATVQRWYDDPLYNDTGRCSTDLRQPCTLGQALAGIHCPGEGVCVADAGFCSDLKDRPCTQADLHLCGSLQANCEPSHDRTIRTVFTHDHFGPSTHQQAGLYAGVVAEPKGSVWRYNETNNETKAGEIMGGYDAEIDQNFAGRTVTENGVSVKDGGPTSWQAVIETPQLGDSFREFLLEVQDSTLLYAPFQVGGNPMALLRPSPCKGNSQPCGFCSLTGRCSNDATTTCQMPPFGGTAPASSSCGTGTCLFGLNPADASNPYLVACTPTDLTACAQPSLESCNFIPGIPSAAWTPLIQTTTQASTQTTTQANTLSGPIDTNLLNAGTGKAITVEAITLRGSTNSFSFNYRDEPLYPRIDSPPSSTSSATAPAPLAGHLGDLAFVYSSLPDRPNPRGGRCSLNLNQLCDPQSSSNTCPSGMGSCEDAGFCSDSYALCIEDNKTLCGETAATCLAQRISIPYSPLTAGIEATDPFTPLLRGYAGDDVQLRVLIGAHINPHNFTLHGLNWLNQPSYVDSGWRNSQAMGISEHYNLLVKLDPLFIPPSAEGSSGAPLKPWMDYLYQPGAAAIEQAAGNWGLIRAYHERRDDLWPLPQNNYRPGTPFKAVKICPDGAPTRDYTVVALTAAQALKGPLVYNATQGISDVGALLFFDARNPGLECPPHGDWSACQYGTTLGMPDPLVLRAAAGDCIHVTLYNGLLNQRQDFCTPANALTTPSPAKGCRDDDACDKGSTCQLYGYCNTAPQTLCTPNNVSVCTTAVACTTINGNSVCNNATTTSCTVASSDCLPLACNALSAGVSSGQLQVLQTADSSAALGTTPAPVTSTTPKKSLTTIATASQSTPAPAYTSNLSLQVGLRPQLVTADPRFGDGTNAGFNPPQTAPPGGSVTYTWYAGHIEPDHVDQDGSVKTVHIPIEFGASNLLPPDPLNQAQHGLFGGLIIEPKGATWDPAAGVGALVHYRDDYSGEHTFHEFVVFTSDDPNLSTLPTVSNPGLQAFDLLNYSTELLNTAQAPPRSCDTSCPSTDFSCVLETRLALSTLAPLYCQCQSSQGTCAVCTPTSKCLYCPACTFSPATPTFVAHVGEEVRFRLLHPGGSNTNEVFELAGHTFLETPYETPPDACEAPTTHANLFASQRMGEQNLCGSAEFLPREMAYRTAGNWSASLGEWKASRPMHGPSNHFDVLIHEAGGPFHRCGDYLYRSYPADHFGIGGIWGIFHVCGCATLPCQVNGTSPSAPAGGGAGGE